MFVCPSGVPLHSQRSVRGTQAALHSAVGSKDRPAGQNHLARGGAHLHQRLPSPPPFFSRILQSPLRKKLFLSRCRRSLSGPELCRIEATALDPGPDLAEPGAAVQPACVLPDSEPGEPERARLESVVRPSGARRRPAARWLRGEARHLPEASAHPELVPRPDHRSGLTADLI